MTITRLRLLLGIVLGTLLIATINRAWATDRYLIGSATLPSSPSIPKTVVDAMNPQGWVLYTQSYGVKEEICEIFLAKTVALADGTRLRNKQPYSLLKEGSLIGVIHLFPEATEDYSVDFHNQTLSPGYYTMRYAVLPAGTYENGTKLGDFVVLSPASRDRDPKRSLKVEELSRLGTATSGSDVPASIELIPPTGDREHPTLKVDQANECILQLRLTLPSIKGAVARDLPVAFALFTPIHGVEGS